MVRKEEEEEKGDGGRRRRREWGWGWKKKKKIRRTQQRWKGIKFGRSTEDLKMDGGFEI